MHYYSIKKYVDKDIKVELVPPNVTHLTCEVLCNLLCRRQKPQITYRNALQVCFFNYSFYNHDSYHHIIFICHHYSPIV